MRTTRIGKAVGACVLATSLVGAMAACSSDSSSSDTYKIGIEAPLSGDQSSLGQGMANGAQLAVEQINAKGGVLGRQVELVQIDDAADAATGVTAAQSAIDAGLNGVVGPYNSSVGVETLPLYIKAGLVPIRLTSDDSTEGLGFTLQPMTSQIAPVTTRAITDFYKAKSVGIIYDETQNYSTSTSAAVKKQLEAANVDVTSYEPVKPGLSSYSDVLSKVEAKNPDLIYSAVYYPEGAKIAQEIKTGSGAASCLLDYASYDNGYIQNAGQAAAQNCKVVGVPAPSDFKGSETFVQAYTDKFNQPPGTWSPYTFDSVNFLVAGVAALGNWDSAPLTENLGAVKDWTGWTGSVSIDAKTGNRNPATVVVTSVTNDGQFTVDPAWAKAVNAPY